MTTRSGDNCEFCQYPLVKIIYCPECGASYDAEDLSFIEYLETNKSQIHHCDHSAEVCKKLKGKQGCFMYG